VARRRSRPRGYMNVPKDTMGYKENSNPEKTPEDGIIDSYVKKGSSF